MVNVVIACGNWEKASALCRTENVDFWLMVCLDFKFVPWQSGAPSALFANKIFLGWSINQGEAMYPFKLVLMKEKLDKGHNGCNSSKAYLFSRHLLKFGRRGILRLICHSWVRTMKNVKMKKEMAVPYHLKKGNMGLFYSKFSHYI